MKLSADLKNLLKIQTTGSASIYQFYKLADYYMKK